MPREDSSCALEKVCERTTSVWNHSRDFVAIRDLKMCGCPANFVHGLALPMARVTGVEDSAKPNGIWTFAWQVAQSRIASEGDIALVVNPRHARTQDQLHIHILRLRPEMDRRFPADFVASVASLDDIWDGAHKKASALHLTDYGILVVKGPSKGFLAVVSQGSPEHRYTQWRCD